MANWQVISLDTTTPQLRAPGTGDGYSFNSGSTQLGVWTTTGLGIGTASPQGPLDVAASGTTVNQFLTGGAGNNAVTGIFKIGSGAGRGASIQGFRGGSSNVHSLDFYTYNSADVFGMRIDQSGNVGIGTASPGAKLEVNTSGNGDGLWLRNSTTNMARLYRGTSGTNPGVLDLYASDVIRVKIDGEVGAVSYFNAGNLGIGTSSPDNKLEVAVGDNAGINIEQTGAGQTGYLNFRDSDGVLEGRISYDHSNNSLRFATSQTEKLRITSAGDVGIGTASPAYKLDVAESGAPTSTNTFSVARISGSDSVANDLTLLGPNTSQVRIKFGDPEDASIGEVGYNHSTNHLRFVTNGAQVGVFDSSGNLGIGTTSPAQKLDVTGTVNSVQARFGNVAGRGLTIGTSSVSGTNDAGVVFNAPTTEGTLIFQTASTERARITSAGNVVVNTAAVATTATDGFLYIPTCAGAPTGVPTTFTGRSPLVVDSTNNRFYVYVNGAWKYATLT